MAKPKTSKRYTREFRRELVALHRAGRSIPELSREFGPTPWTIALWVKQADRDSGRGDGGLTTNEREELARLRRENKRLKMEREILAKAATTWAQGFSTSQAKRHRATMLSSSELRPQNVNIEVILIKRHSVLGAPADDSGFDDRRQPNRIYGI
jgi:transposase